MKICVLNPGVVHAIPRTIAFSLYFDEVHYIDLTGKDNRELLERNNIIYYAPFSDGKYNLGSIRLQKLFHTIAPDGIICHFAHGTHFFNSILYNRCPVAIIAMGHDIFNEEGFGYVSFLSKALIRMGLRRSEYISAKSIRLKKKILTYQTKATVDVNYWGADLSLFRQGNINESRQKLGIPINIPVVLSPRAIEPRLNTHLILEAFYTVKNKYPEARLIILGRAQKEYKQKIEKLIHERNIEQSIDLIGEVNQIDLIDYYNAADVVVSVAQSEGFPNTVLEVLACKRPIVLGNIPHIEELIKDGYGAKVTNLNMQDIAAAIIDIIQNNSQYIKMVNMGYAIVKKYGNISTNGAQFAVTFKDIIQKSGKIKKSYWNILPFWFVFIAHALHRKITRT